MSDQKSYIGATYSFLLFLAGVLLPASVFIIELTTGWCAADLFDPIPSVPHALLVLFVPAANLLIWAALSGRIKAGKRTLGVVNGFSAGICFYYALLFLPITPMALIAILFFGLGLLPLSPAISFLAAVKNIFVIKRLPDPQAAGNSHEGLLIRPKLAGINGTFLGFFMFLLTLIVIELPITITRMEMNVAAYSDHRSRISALKWLRTIGDEDFMLRACYGRTGVPQDFMNFTFGRGDVTPEKAREIYYSVTGVPFNAVPPPTSYRRGRGDFFSWNFDRDQGTQNVAGRINGLNLESSRLDGSVDADAALAYIQWTMEFKNDSQRQQEARCRVSLPAGGVVSRLTLWVDGEEREAAFAATGKVVEAYRKVVASKRDPVLVTTCGTDRILVQCFPVPPNGGSMKIRIGITTPLIRSHNSGQGTLTLPYIFERNFNINEDKHHLVWLESKREISFPGGILTKEQSGENLHVLRGNLPNQDMIDKRTAIKFVGSPEITESWAEDDIVKDGFIVRQKLVPRSYTPADKVVAVVDGSAGMKAHQSEIVKVLGALGEKKECRLIFASDEVVEFPKNLNSSSWERCLSELTFTGGADNIPALRRAWEIACSEPETDIIWIHGPQPVELQSIEPLRQMWERRPNKVKLLSLEVVPGRNVVMEKMNGVPFLNVVSRIGSLPEDVAAVYSDHAVVAVRERIPRNETADYGRKTSDHLVRLWALDEVRRLTSTADGVAKKQAAEIACAYHLVTTETGAVALENDVQYRQSGLDLRKAMGFKVPTVPEPEEWLLIFVTAGLLIIAVLKDPRILARLSCR